LRHLGKHDRHRQWTRHEPEDEPEVRLARRVFHTSVRTGHSLGRGVSKIARGDYPLRNISKGKAVLLLVLLGLGVLFTADQLMKTEATPVSPNQQMLWSDNLASNNLNGWNQRLSSFTGSGVSKRILQDSNSTFSAIAISKVSFTMDTVAGHQLAFDFTYAQDVSPTNIGLTWGYFLTTNNTIPNESGSWAPKDDPEVAFYLEVVDTGGGGITVNVYMQKRPTISIATDDPTAQVGTGGSRFLTGTEIQATTVGTYNFVNSLLNFTGNTGNGYSNMDIGATGSTTVYTEDDFPWLNFQGQFYYLGFFFQNGASSTGIRWMIHGGPPNGMEIYRSDPIPSTPAPPNPVLDTGGFFGPLIRALISIGIFILTAIATFLGYVADAFITAMDAAGNFLGLGAIGTSIRSFFTDIASFIANVFGTVIGWLSTISSLFQNGIGFITNFFSGSNGFVAWIISWFTSIGSLWAIVQDLWTALNTVVLAMNAILVIYYLAGMFWVYIDGWPGFRDWLDLGTTFTIKIFKLGFVIAKESWGVLLTIKQILTGWI